MILFGVNDMIRIQSSASNLMHDKILVVMSLMYHRNMSGPSTVPWGTPDQNRHERKMSYDP